MLTARANVSLDFGRSWAEYKQIFGDVSGNHWLGEYTEYKQGFWDVSGNHFLSEYTKYKQGFGDVCGNHCLGEYTKYKQGFGDVCGNHWLGRYLLMLVQWWFVYPNTFVPGQYFWINEFSGLLNRPIVRTWKSVPTLYVRTSEISGLSESGLTNHHCKMIPYAVLCPKCITHNNNN